MGSGYATLGSRFFAMGARYSQPGSRESAKLQAPETCGSGRRREMPADAEPVLGLCAVTLGAPSSSSAPAAEKSLRAGKRKARRRKSPRRKRKVRGQQFSWVRGPSGPHNLGKSSGRNAGRRPAHPGKSRRTFRPCGPKPSSACGCLSLERTRSGRLGPRFRTSTRSSCRPPSARRSKAPARRSTGGRRSAVRGGATSA